MKKNYQSVAIIIILVISGFVILKKKESISGFSSDGDYIETICLEDSSHKKVLIDDNVEDYSILLIFGSTCISCNGNNYIWNRLSLLENANSYGILMRGEPKELVNAIKFPILKPYDSVKFNSKIHLRSGVNYTVVIKKGVIEYLKMGILSIEDYLVIKHLIKEGEIS